MSDNPTWSLAEKRKFLREENKRFSYLPVRLEREKWPPLSVQVQPLEVWRSSAFLVQVFDERQGWLRLSVCRTELAAEGGWRDGITWDELHWLKSACGYGDRNGYEAFPSRTHLVNVANMRHLWLLPDEEMMPRMWHRAAEPSRPQSSSAKAEGDSARI